MKKIASLLMCLVILASTTFGQTAQSARQTKKSTVQTATSSASAHLKKDGTVDKRFKSGSAAATTGPLKKDGTPDKRYKANKKL